MGSLEFSKQLLSEAKVAVSPGIGFGEYGDELRALRADRKSEHRTRQAIRGITGHVPPRPGDQAARSLWEG